MDDEAARLLDLMPIDAAARIARHLSPELRRHVCDRALVAPSRAR